MLQKKLQLRNWSVTVTINVGGDVNSQFEPHCLGKDQSGIELRKSMWRKALRTSNAENIVTERVALGEDTAIGMLLGQKGEPHYAEWELKVFLRRGLRSGKCVACRLKIAKVTPNPTFCVPWGNGKTVRTYVCSAISFR